MFILFLLVTICSISLYSMESSTTEKWNLYKQCRLKSIKELTEYPQYHDINDVIDVAEYARDGHLMAKLIHVCLPEEVSKNHIAPYLSTIIATKYKYNVIQNKQFNIKQISKNSTIFLFTQHDGKCFPVPKINNLKKPYTSWDGNSYCTLSVPLSTENDGHIREKKFVINKAFIHNENHYSILCTPSENEAFKLCLMGYGKGLFTTISNANQTTKCLFSNDGSILAINTPPSKILVLYNILSSNFKEITLRAPVTALCAAHHAPLFAVSVDNGFTIINHQTMDWANYNVMGDPLIHIEFSPNDAKLLICSNNGENTYDVTVLHTETMKCLYSIQYSRQILKAFFINNESVVLIKKNGYITILNTLNPCITNRYRSTHTDDIFITWCNKHKLLLLYVNDEIKICDTKNGLLLNTIPTKEKIAGIGLPIDENSIILMDKKNNTYRIELYNENNCNIIDFIEKKANIIQLYEMLNVIKLNKLYHKDVAPELTSYINEQKSS